MRRRNSFLAAAFIAVLIGVWLISGQDGAGDPPPPSPAEQAASRGAGEGERRPVRVRARVVRASPQVRSLRIRGKTEYKRTVTARVEVAGTVVARPVERGTVVAAGDVLCRLSVDDREAAMLESEAALKRAQLEHEASLRLRSGGFQSETLAAQTEERLAAARTRLTRSRLDLARVEVRAPFDGIVEDVHAETGDYVTRESPCATIVDPDPVLLVGRVPERDVAQVSAGMPAQGSLGRGGLVTGSVSFVGQVSDPETRSYALEIEVPNSDRRMRSGTSVEIRIPVAEVMAQKVSPALFVLNDDGVVGLRTVDAGGRVAFNPIEIVRDDGDGMWVAGLPDTATLITVGQGLVGPGQAVEMDLEAPATEADTAAPAAGAGPAAPPPSGGAADP